ncbi:MAG TPA: histone deacetylase family protein [Candidatus Hydrogenedentes bacterium]|nr:histone deacetylase family protein [Candidatus Hydrogenedentota bacterium]HIJ73872.1 histone deacetylase family protein [Candidatus Hydrogenedentota bacterium]
MNVIYTERHRLHRPDHELGAGGHPEVAERAERIAEALRVAGFPFFGPRDYEPGTLATVHAAEYIRRLSAAGRGVFDTDTPIGEHTFEAAAASAGCALTGADLLLAGERCVYALCRPPGHHAGHDYCAGFCYLNNAALAATRLRGSDEARRVAILDVDYHHGNGTQEIFYDSGEVFYVSLHADPRTAYPYRWGFREQTGAGPGSGCNLNLPLPHGTDEATYLEALERALDAVAAHAADFLIVSLGTDTFIGDPLGTFTLSTESYGKIAGRAAKLGLPTLVVQEGGYNLDAIGECVTNFCTGLQPT